MVRAVWKYLLLLLSVCLFCTPLYGQEGPSTERPVEVYFAAVDPGGGRLRAGKLCPPRNLAFRPYEGLYDLLSFRVSGDGEQLFLMSRLSR